MADVTPEQAAKFFRTAEVHLHQATIMVGCMPATARAHAIDAKPKRKPTVAMISANSDMASGPRLLSHSLREPCNALCQPDEETKLR